MGVDENKDIRIMKLIFLGIAFVLSSILMAQENGDLETAKLPSKQYKPIAGMGSSEASLLVQTGNGALRIDIPEIKGRYFTKDKFAYRTKILANYQNDKSTIDMGQGDMIRKITESSFQIVPGFEKHSSGTVRMSPYWGIELPVGIAKYNYSMSNSIDGQSYTKEGNFNAQTKGSFNIGIGVLGGIDYYIANNIFIGAEVSVGYLFSEYGDREVTYSSPTVKGKKTTPLGRNRNLDFISSNGLRLGIVF